MSRSEEKGGHYTVAMPGWGRSDELARRAEGSCRGCQRSFRVLDVRDSGNLGAE